MKELSHLLEERNIEYDPIKNRIPCFPHMINICVKHIVDDYTTADFSSMEKTWNVCGQIIDKNEYVGAIIGKALERARTLVRTIRASNQRHSNFRDTIVIGNENNWFQGDKGEPIKLPEVELLLDEPTRWDSVYVMLNHLHNLHQAVDMFFDSPNQRSINNKKLSPIEWHFLQDFEVILEPPHRAQQSMSSESTPMLGRMVPVFERLLEDWKQVANSAPHCAPLINIGLTWAEKYDDRMSSTNAYVCRCDV
ncbi:ribonuclease H-like domain-containing protein [Suillus americanus]|nr:ribonuclease H-like domain-containing protein [Suillus americanus]